MIIRSEETDNLVYKLLLNDILSQVKKSLQMFDATIIALSGGNTPKPLYRLLGSNLKNNGMLPKINFIQVDERYVPANHSRSNQKMILKQFNLPNMKFYPIPTNRLDWKPEKVAEMYDNKIKKIMKDQINLSLDCIILGMGNDGHIASLFPYNETYLSQLDTPIANVIETYVSKLNEYRISLTSHFINQFSKKYLLMFGKDKANTLAQAMKSGDLSRFPILSVLEGLELYTLHLDANIIRKSFE